MCLSCPARRVFNFFLRKKMRCRKKVEVSSSKGSSVRIKFGAVSWDWLHTTHT